jgi:hypothetical protein
VPKASPYKRHKIAAGIAMLQRRMNASPVTPGCCDRVTFLGNEPI